MNPNVTGQIFFLNLKRSKFVLVDTAGTECLVCTKIHDRMYQSGGCNMNFTQTLITGTCII